MSIQISTTETIENAKSWCKFIEDTVEGLRYYYVIGEIADRPNPDEWLKFDVVISPLDKNFLTYIHQCCDLQAALLHTLKDQLIEVPIVNAALLEDAERMVQQHPAVSGEIFYLTAYEKHDNIREAPEHRPPDFTALNE